MAECPTCGVSKGDTYSGIDDPEGLTSDQRVEAMKDSAALRWNTRAQSGSVSVKSFDPVVLSMLLTAAENCAPVYRGSVLRAYDYIKALAGKGEG